MAFVKNKRLFVVDEDGIGHEQEYTVLNQEFLTADRNTLFSLDEYRQAILSPISSRVTRIFLLNDDETIRSDISEFLVSGNVSMTQASGIRSSGSMSLFNMNKMFSPNVVNGILWEGTKLRIDTGIYFYGHIYWQRLGIFAVHDPAENEDNNSVSFSIYDKFALVDGTIGGKRDSEFKIPTGTLVKDAIALCLNPDDNLKSAYDCKTVIFPMKYKNETTPYTITKDPNCTMGEIIIELSKMISCDAYYNELGNLVVHSDNDDINYETAPIQWIYRDEDLLTGKPTVSYMFANVAKKVTVFGAIEDGKQYQGVFENKNPLTCHYTQNLLHITDSNIIGDDLCFDRAKYEYKKSCRLNIQLKFEGAYIPHLLPDSIVLWSNKDLKYKNDKFIINSIDIDLMNSEKTNMSLTYLEGLRI